MRTTITHSFITRTRGIGLTTDRSTAFIAGTSFAHDPGEEGAIHLTTFESTKPGSASGSVMLTLAQADELIAQLETSVREAREAGAV